MGTQDDRFCYLNHIRGEHNRLNQLSRQVADRFQLSRESSWEDGDRPEIAAMLSTLREELSRHVNEEEQGGCIDEAVARMPSLSAAARRVFQASDRLKERLQKIMQLVEFSSRAEAETAFQEFASKLRLHERHEELLVEKGMNAFPFED